MRPWNPICIAVLCAAACTVACQDSPKSDEAVSAAEGAGAQRAPVAEFREVTVPAGTTLAVSLDDSVGSASSSVDQPVRAHLTRAVTVDGVVALPAGSELSGAVVEAERSAKIKGRAHIALRFNNLRLADGETHTIRSADISRTANGTVKKDAMKVGIPAAAGAVVGGLLGGGKGAAIGGAMGGGGGAAYVMSERGPEVSIGRGSALSVKLLESIKVRVRAGSGAGGTAAN